VAEVLLLLWLVEDWVVLGCELGLALEPLPLPVCAARHRLASRSGEASHIFFIPKEPPNAFFCAITPLDRWLIASWKRAPKHARADGY
jgi:hypothetical protein